MMATQDDDLLTGLAGFVPEPDAEPTPGELAHARRFAELVDKTQAGRTPPAMSADDRALLEVATVIRATRGHVELAPARQHEIVEDALRLALGARVGGGGTPVPSLPRPRPRAARFTPWLITGASTLVAAAAVATLWLRAPRPAVAAQFPPEWMSRSADALVGPIARDRSGDAGVRIDEIFADRLDGLRARRLARGGKR
jgi:hypothetical protein